ncbi:MAG: hypothetical protein VX278_11610 [Myxococcota bacterium]|nr:hypothetical protein [Myxococcota bacterium]
MFWFTTFAMLACTGDKTQGEEEAFVEGRLSLYPPAGGLGKEVEIDLEANRSTFSFSDTTVDFGEGILIGSVTVDDGWHARAQIMIEPGATLGARDVIVTSDGRDYTLSDSFEVVSESFILEPSNAKMGELVDIGLLGSNTDWQSGLTWPNFGDGVEVLEFSVLSPTLAEATISIDPDASPGWRNVTVDSGSGNYAVLYDGFKIDRVGLAAEFEPVVAEQGRMVEFTIRARGTDFLSSNPRIVFFDRFGENPDIVVNDMTVLDAENLYGRMTLSNAAALGNRDVVIETIEDSVRVPDAFEVIGGDWDLSRVAISLDFSVQRVLDQSTCEVVERVNASALFYIPLDPPCGGGGAGQPPPSPSPYDNNGVFEYPPGEGGDAEDCPFPTTLGAGDYVWFESDANIVTLEKTYDSASGTVYYTNNNLTLADYVGGQMYDLHTQGEEGGLGEYLLEGVQPTVPAHWDWLTPDLCGLTHDRSEDFDFTWTPAMTYPDAIFGVFMDGLLEVNGNAGFAGTFPWDDGMHGFLSSEMSQLQAGPVSFRAFSYIEGPYFGLPESLIQDNQSSSQFILATSFNLE